MHNNYAHKIIARNQESIAKTKQILIDSELETSSADWNRREKIMSQLAMSIK